MSFIDEVRAKRKKLADVLSDEDYSGIREIVEELYPDRAHFIYELLQNAEDTGATVASFILEKDSVSFVHNGRPFSEADVLGITNIGKGSKKDQEDQIGRFGVGFKAVFAYTETPHIWSPTFSFKISELVLPTTISAKPDLGQKTRFEFPFNNEKKSAQDAYEEVKAGLAELAETTLLFLSHLKSIRWQIGEKVSGEILRIQHSENHIEVVKNADGKMTASSHFLRFSNSVEGLERQQVSVAFELDYLPNVTVFDPRQALAKQLKIVPADPGTIAVFFPAEKEASGLRFHLHAPFVPELSRASIKETPANYPLLKQLANLAAASLYSIRDLNLLTGEFLSVLPNPQDYLPIRYELIRSAIIEEMNDEPLTPTYSRYHAPARRLLQAMASLKELLSAEDIEFLVDYDDVPFQWAIGATQKNNNVDRFLAGLAITDWDIDEFIDHLRAKLSERRRYLKSFARYVDGPDPEFLTWLAAKPVEWHQQLYALLHDEIFARHGYGYLGTAGRLKSLHIIRLSNGNYSTGSECYFPSNGVEHDEILPRVAKGVYTSGKSKNQKEKARKLLEGIGVREVGETEQVQAILKQRYAEEAEIPDEKAHLKHINRFIALVEKVPDSARLFADFYIFKCADDQWRTPSGVYLDSPFLKTGLSAYYDPIGSLANRAGLSKSYRHEQVPMKTFLKFAEKVGVQVRLEIKEVSCHDNPAEEDLMWNALGKWSSSYGINEDYTIEGLENLLTQNSEALSHLVWKTVCEREDNDWLCAKYSKNSQHYVRTAPSQIVWILRVSAWIPQTDGRFVRPSEASRDLLPKGFPYDEGYEWLKAVRFGEEDKNRSEEGKRKLAAAKELLGVSDADAIERAKKFASIPREEQERILAEIQRRQSLELPEREPSNPERRAKIVEERAANAPERITEKRQRSVSVDRDAVTQEAKQYLREQYTNGGRMICQICKDELPFKLDDGSYYFETVEFSADLKKRHYQNYLALCPNHSAMFQHANGSRDDLKGMLCELVGNELEIILAQRDAAIYFTKTHLADLKMVIEVDSADM